MKGDVNTTTRDEWTPLQLAIYKGHIKVVELITDRIDLDVNFHSHGGTALHMAAKIGNANLVCLILNHPSINLK